MSDECPKCGAPATLYCDFGVVYECETSITHGKIEEGEDCLRCQLDHAQARYDALRITSETTIGQLRQQAKHLEDRAKELETENEKLKTVRTKLQGKLRPLLSNIPQGYQRLSAYTNGTEVIVTGPPPSEDDDPECEIHNCDQMGCNWEHALLRQDVNWFWLGCSASS